MSRDLAAARDEGAPRRHEHTVPARTFLLGIGILLGGIVLLLLIHAVIGPLLLIAASIIIAEALRPPVEALAGRGMPRGVAILLAYLVLGSIAFFILSLLLHPLLVQTSSLVHNLPTYAGRAQVELGRLQQSIRGTELLSPLSDQVRGLVGGTVHTVLILPQQLFGGFITLLFMAVLVFFWLSSTPALRALLLSVTPADTHATLLAVLAEQSRVLGGWVRGVLLNMVLLGSLSAIALLLFGVPYALLLGLLAGLTQIIPYVGAWIAGVPAVTLAYLAGGPVHAAQVAAVCIVLQQVAGVVFVPLVMHSTVRLHPLLTTCALLIGAVLLGLTGAVLSVPLAAALQIPVTRVVLPALQRRAAQTRSRPPLAPVGTRES
ncbi:MAG: AI-2E family transporter [Chloroflexota bacterium]